MTPDDKVPIYCNLDYVGMDGEGNIHLILHKDTSDEGINKILIDMLKPMQGEDVCIIVSRMHVGE